jgi:hypothetical protein
MLYAVRMAGDAGLTCYAVETDLSNATRTHQTQYKDLEVIYGYYESQSRGWLSPR